MSDAVIIDGAVEIEPVRHFYLPLVRYDKNGAWYPGGTVCLTKEDALQSISNYSGVVQVVLIKFMNTDTVTSNENEGA
ncbi:MAG: hypothetical protein D6706_20060 [Chloroflexi bacterium]|nr:MAG: hypothetical protein D6706_20060 [Chloroflexota bacterium]